MRNFLELFKNKNNQELISLFSGFSDEEFEKVTELLHDMHIPIGDEHYDLYENVNRFLYEEEVKRDFGFYSDFENINWEYLSEEYYYGFTIEFLRMYKEFLNWKEVSTHSRLTKEIQKEFKDLLDFQLVTENNEVMV